MKTTFTGNFWEFLGWSYLGILITVLTFGLFAPIMLYFQVKYFVEHIELKK